MAARFMDRSTPIDRRSYQSARVLYEKRAGHSAIPFHSLSLPHSLSVCMIDRPDRVRVRSAEKNYSWRVFAPRDITRFSCHINLPAGRINCRVYRFGSTAR